MNALEIACDESGSEGEKLIGGETDVFAHASIGLGVEAAEACVQEIRDRIRSPAVEYKANHLLRAKNRPVLVWLLGPSGPIHGHARVHLTDKTFFLLGKLTSLLLGAPEVATTLYRDGPRVFGQARWDAFLEAGNNLLRVKNRRAVRPVEEFQRVVDELSGPGALSDTVERFRAARPQAEAFRARVREDPQMIPPLDSWLPAIIRAVAAWKGDSVSIVHDEQLTLSEERVSQLKAVIGDRLAGIRLVDSRSDARVQVADFLAGVARKIASEELNHRGDAELIAALRPYVDPFSIWVG